MKKIILFFIFILFSITALCELTHSDFGSIHSIPTDVQQRMKRYTWRPGCPVSSNQLSYVEVPYWGFDDQPHEGVLIVNRRVAREVLIIFQRLFAVKFPIEKIKPMYLYQGDDLKAIADNNTSAFNCRKMIGNAAHYSVHSYGLAIDINPLINPYVKGSRVLPPAGRIYLDRNNPKPGMIVIDDVVYRAFSDEGWSWGGSWRYAKDYQHFEKTFH